MYWALLFCFLFDYLNKNQRLRWLKALTPPRREVFQAGNEVVSIICIHQQVMTKLHGIKSFSSVVKLDEKITNEAVFHFVAL